MSLRLVIVSLALGLAGAAAAAEAQAPARPGNVRVTVRDATDLPIAGATVVLVTPAGDVGTATTNERGQAAIETVPPGTYGLRIESPGFEVFTQSDVVVRANARTSREVVLQIAGLVEQVDVAPAAADRAVMDAFTSQLTADQIAALPDDPDELAAVLQQLVGNDVELRIDGFAGQLPAGAQIQEVRIRWDGGGANSSGGGPRIEIRTAPGGDRWRSNANFSVRDESLNARNAFSNERPSGQTRQYGWSVNGPLVKGRTGVSLSIDGSEALEQQAIRPLSPNGLVSRLISQPNTRLAVSGRVEHAINPAQTLRVDFRRNRSDAENQGIGEFDLPERAYSRHAVDGELRVSHRATLRRRYVNDLRVQYRWQSAESSPLSDATTIRVLDAFTSGGAQIYGGRRSRDFNLENELEFTIRGSHQISTGISVTSAHDAGDEIRNATGTFTFASLDDYAAGLPTTFSQRLGDPSFSYSLHQFGWFVQDDYRVRRNLMINLGLRHELQTRLRDWANFSPRIGVNWTPSAKWRTTLRASVGMFHQYFDGGMYEQTIRVNGRQQQDLVIAAPGYPDPFSDGAVQAGRAPGIIRARADLSMPYTRRLNLGFDQPITRELRLRANYSRQAGRKLFRSIDVNAPVDGVRPDPSLRNITQLESTARSRNQSFEVGLSFNQQPRRLSSNINYVLGEAFNESDGAFTLPPDSRDLSAEWGPSRQDIRHRLNASLETDLWAGFRVNGNLRRQSAAPYTITTGLDGNGDGVNNERPEGVGRNTARGRPTTNVDLGVTWGLRLGRRTPLSSAAQGRPAGPQGGAAVRGNPNPIFRFEIYARATNALNIVNPQNFSGVLTSPFFGQPTSASAARRIVMGTRVWF
jgi:hypothetical protein